MRTTTRFLACTTGNVTVFVRGAGRTIGAQAQDAVNRAFGFGYGYYADRVSNDTWNIRTATGAVVGTLDRT